MVRHSRRRQDFKIDLEMKNTLSKECSKTLRINSHSKNSFTIRSQQLSHFDKELVPTLELLPNFMEEETTLPSTPVHLIKQS